METLEGSQSPISPISVPLGIFVPLAVVSKIKSKVGLPDPCRMRR